ncbi:DUF433 domain-containing protein [Parafilimonas terrae]|jgi:uncharacterized protein (DUF433 family)|uniref:Uncharacterized conserved protein, DUF433 family n=1 Tax=Parafilimonas terrae TaxID=1465490 RepID=A0A1I5WE62_9BACT|nr:DUF433 domain-containing protein [Parafilimonas terrae]SFQ17887.1 Uncharacterized conserved protein, DUF433 family [Parafilimonas terrae]
MNILPERITVDKNILDGKPSIRGKRISVQTILEFLSAGETHEEILHQYPSLEEEDIQACLKYAANISGMSYTIQPIIVNA